MLLLLPWYRIELPSSKSSALDFDRNKYPLLLVGCKFCKREQNFSSICMPLNSMLVRSSSSIIYFSNLAQKANGNRGGREVAIDVIKWPRPETDSLIMYNGTVFQRTSAVEVEKVDHFQLLKQKSHRKSSWESTLLFEQVFCLSRGGHWRLCSEMIDFEVVKLIDFIQYLQEFRDKVTFIFKKLDKLVVETQ